MNRAPVPAAKVRVEGLTSGGSTGMSLDDTINDEGVDFWNSRRIVNGDVEQYGDLVASHAEVYARVLRSGDSRNSLFQGPAVS